MTATSPSTTTGTAQPSLALPATSRVLWAAGLVLLVATLAGRLPVLRAYVLGRLADSPQVTGALTDPHLRDLAVNVGLTLAVTVATLLYVLYQSLGRVLEKHVFTAMIPVARVRVGLFFLIASLSTLPPAMASALVGQVSLRGHWWFYAWVIGVGFAVPWLFRPHLRHVKVGRKAILFAVAVIFALMGTLV